MGLIQAFAAECCLRSAAFLITSQEDELGHDIKRKIQHFVYPQKRRAQYNTPIHWARSWAIEFGPEPYAGRQLADEWNLPRASRAKAKKSMWTSL